MKREQFWICIDARSLSDIRDAIKLGNLHGHYDHMITDIVSKTDMDMLLDECKRKEVA